MKRRLVNLTPHDVVVHTTNGATLTFPSMGELRLQANPQKELSDVIVGDGEHASHIRCKTAPRYDDLAQPMPQVEREHCDGIIVSMLVAQFLLAHPRLFGAEMKLIDVYAVDDVVRNERGVPIGCRSLVRYDTFF